MMEEVFPLVISVHMKYLGSFVLVLCAIIISEQLIDVIKRSLLVGRRSSK